MGQGLGKNSPIVLSLGKESYEAMIDRHGQYVRWRVAKKCPCAKESGQPDIHCELCAGTGDIYSWQSSITSNIRCPVIDGIIDLPEDIKDIEVKAIYDRTGNKYKAEKVCHYLKIDDKDAHLAQGELVDVVYTTSLIYKIESTPCIRVCDGFYTFPELRTETSSIEGVYYNAPFDVTDARLKTPDGTYDVHVKSFYKNSCQVEKIEDYPATLIATSVSYIKPLKFVVLSQNFDKETLYLVQKHNGEAVCTFPYMYDVSENDIITVLSGFVTNKVVIKKVAGDDDDVLPEYFVDNIVSLQTLDKHYQDGKDFILVGTNRIHWISDNRPAPKENMSITFRYNPTYRVAQSIANLRTSENQRLPRKVILRQLSTFQEARGVSYND